MTHPRWDALVEAARRSSAGTATPGDIAALDRVALRPLTGGMNNTLFRLQHDGRDLCLKLHRVDHRDRAHREWQALTLLTQRGHPRVPQPLWRSDREDLPAIVMTYAAGTPLGGAHLQPAHLDALTAALTDLYSITPADVTDALSEVVTPATAMLQRLHDTCTSPTASAEQRRLVDLWRRWSAGPDPDLIRAPIPQQVFGRGDPSLANALWDGAELTLLDFEYSGWTDPAYELADLIEHPRSRATPDSSWRDFTDRFGLSPGAQARHEAARRMLALFWLTRRQPDDPRHPS